jgi:hypothetical protein
MEAVIVIPVSFRTLISRSWLVIATWTVLGKRSFAVATRRSIWVWPR